MKTKEHKESNGCEKYYCWRYALYKINFWTILKKLLQKNDFRRFPLFEIFAHVSQQVNTKDCYLTVLGLQDVLEQGGLPGTKEAAEQRDRHLVISASFLKLSVSKK